MCTVTLIPVKKSNFVLTSSRDEAGDRETIAPDFYKENGAELLYPKDKQAGGTWIGLSDRERLICLLNGGFEDHPRGGSYRKSRGLVTKELLVAEDFDKAIKKYDFFQIEPFTMVVVEWKRELRFVEFVWDGERKHFKELDQKSHIWSSSPLYNSEMKATRKNWFRDFRKNSGTSSQDLWEFHHSAGMGDKNTGLIMDRGFVKTQSITQVTKTGTDLRMIYKEVSSSEVIQQIFPKKN